MRKRWDEQEIHLWRCQCCCHEQFVEIRLLTKLYLVPMDLLLNSSWEQKDCGDGNINSKQTRCQALCCYIRLSNSGFWFMINCYSPQKRNGGWRKQSCGLRFSLVRQDRQHLWESFMTLWIVCIHPGHYCQILLLREIVAMESEKKKVTCWKFAWLHPVFEEDEFLFDFTEGMKKMREHQKVECSRLLSEMKHEKIKTPLKDDLWFYGQNVWFSGHDWIKQKKKKPLEMRCSDWMAYASGCGRAARFCAAKIICCEKVHYPCNTRKNECMLSRWFLVAMGCKRMSNFFFTVIWSCGSDCGTFPDFRGSLATEKSHTSIEQKHFFLYFVLLTICSAETTYRMLFRRKSRCVLCHFKLLSRQQISAHSTITMLVVTSERVIRCQSGFVSQCEGKKEIFFRCSVGGSDNPWKASFNTPNTTRWKAAHKSLPLFSCLLEVCGSFKNPNLPNSWIWEGKFKL